MSDDRLTETPLPDEIRRAISDLAADSPTEGDTIQLRKIARLESAILAAMEEARRGAIEEAKGVCGDLMLLPFPGYRSALAEAVRRIGALSLPQSPREPIQWDPCASGFWTVEELNRRYGAGRFVALGGPDTLYDTGPDRKGKAVVPAGSWICDGKNGEPCVVASLPPPPCGNPKCWQTPNRTAWVHVYECTNPPEPQPPGSREPGSGGRCAVCGSERPVTDLMLACCDGHACVAALDAPAPQTPAPTGTPEECSWARTADFADHGERRRGPHHNPKVCAMYEPAAPPTTPEGPCRYCGGKDGKHDPEQDCPYDGLLEEP
jgi:hypothetical protein